eukprot:scaffold108353_cov37-Prasinocladus_malaysianus.AAC.1
MNQGAIFDEQLQDCDLPPSLSGPIHMKGLGLYRLKGIKLPTMLVQAWLPALDASSVAFPAVKGNVAELAAADQQLDRTVTPVQDLQLPGATVSF